jgi:hypothetical protein
VNLTFLGLTPRFRTWMMPLERSGKAGIPGRHSLERGNPLLDFRQLSG